MTVAIDITNEQRSTLLALLRRFIPGVAVWAYGSRVKWTARPNSDLDLVAFTTPLQRPQVAELKDALAESNLPFPVDLHVWDEVPERFREIIRKEYVVLQEAKQPGSGSNMAGWKNITLGDFVALQRGHDLTEPERRPGHVPVVGSAGQNGFHDTALAKGPGIVIGRSGASFGQVHFCTTDYWPHNTGLYVTDFKGNDPRFAYYFLKALDFDRYNSGSAQPSLNRNFIYPIPICVPESAEQKSIAHVIGTLDDKIELNRRMNETLEAMARALFKSWFVDFLPVRANMEARNRKARTQTGDPVRAKAEGRDHSLPKHIADLFPDSFENSELGEIPKGWETEPFAGTIEILGGGTPKTSSPEYWNGAIPWFSVVDAPSDTDVWVIDTEKKITQAGVENSSTQILPVGTTIITARGTVGRIALVGVPMAMNQSCYGLRGKDDIHGYYTYFAARQIVSSLQQHAHGSVFDTITRDTLAGVSVVVPPPHLVEAFEKIVSLTLERIRAGLFVSSTLATLRDALLPKLISGELRVKDAERIVEIV